MSSQPAAITADNTPAWAAGRSEIGTAAVDRPQRMVGRNVVFSRMSDAPARGRQRQSNLPGRSAGFPAPVIQPQVAQLLVGQREQWP